MEATTTTQPADPTPQQQSAPQPPPPATQAVATRPPREVRVVQDDSELANLMDTARFEQCYRIAQAMARASLIPKHLKGETPDQTAANCFLVVNQAFRWKMDPFAIAPATYEVGGRLGYEGKLVAAVINARAGLAEKLSYAFTGKGDDMMVTVSGRLADEDEPRTVTVTVKQARTANAIWTKDPEQKLVYTGAIKWARRHKPEIIMGVLTDDDIESIREEQRAASAAKPPQMGRRERVLTPAEAKTVEPATAVNTDSNATTTAQESPPQTEPAPEGTQGAPEPSETSNPDDGDLAPQAAFKPNPNETEELQNVRFLMHRSGVKEAQVMAWARKNSMAKPDQKLADLSGAKLKTIGSSWPNSVAEIKAIKE